MAPTSGVETKLNARAQLQTISKLFLSLNGFMMIPRSQTSPFGQKRKLFRRRREVWAPTIFDTMLDEVRTTLHL